MINKELLQQDITLLRKKSPLVLSITNYVAANFTANVLLAVGASPVMAHAPEELDDLTAKVDALNLNIGTIDAQQLQSMLYAGQAMLRQGKPIVLDPVGAGASTYRTNAAWQIIHTCHPTIIRGNASEIMALAHQDSSTRGVDSTIASSDALSAAEALAKQTGCIVSISGATDYITNGKSTESVCNGSPMQTLITGTGCSLSALAAAFATVNINPLQATTHAIALVGIAGEKAASMATGPGSLQTHFLDLLYTLTPEQITKTLRQ